MTQATHTPGLLLSSITVICVGIAMTHISGSVTITFGKQPYQELAVALSKMEGTK